MKMKMKKIGVLLLAAFLSLGPAAARKDAKAKEVLDKTAAALKTGGGVKADFDGSMKGSLKMRGKQFYLKANDIESWYDGKTQWSYMQRAEEVSVSSPTPEEAQAVNPYLLLSAYQNGYQYEYAGTTSYRGRQAHKVVLTPDKVTTVSRITVLVSTGYQPIYIKVENTQGKAAELYVTAYATGQNYTDATFRFDAKKYPDAEIVDMR
jgi:outer membrane lipoprotein-sorting protein